MARPADGHEMAAQPVKPIAREVVISRMQRISRGLADLSRRAVPRPQAPPRRTRILFPSGLLPRTVQLCIHCRENPAGFWVSRKDASVVRRPWCLSCCQELDLSSCHVIRFGS